MKKEPLEPEAKSAVNEAEDDAHEHAVEEATGDNDSDLASRSETHSEYSDEPEIDKSGWPLLYKIMDVGPETLDSDIKPMLEK